jgi:hypothetical protein
LLSLFIHYFPQTYLNRELAQYISLNYLFRYLNKTKKEISNPNLHLVHVVWSYRLEVDLGVINDRDLLLELLYIPVPVNYHCSYRPCLYSLFLDLTHKGLIETLLQLIRKRINPHHIQPLITQLTIHYVQQEQG